MDWNRLSLFKLPNRHKRFEYVPRYFDPQKEELRKKLRQAEIENGGDVDVKKLKREIQFKSKIENKWGNSELKSQKMRSNIRLIIIFICLIIAFYYIFKGLDVMGLFIDENLRK
jgi:hypothetical protein